MTGELRGRLARMWAFRARFERQAEAHFRQLAAGLEATGAPVELVRLAHKAADDEARHAVLAVGLARRFGIDEKAAPVASVPSPAPGSMALRERVLYEAVALCAVMETISAAMLRQMRERATDLEAREVVHAILVDEITHSRIGWGMLAFEAQRGSVVWLGPLLPAMLRATVQEEIFGPPEGAHGAALEPWGGLRRELRRAEFEASVRGLVLPGLDHLGVPIEHARAWVDALPSEHEAPA